jgi:hypothetical protein
MSKALWRLVLLALLGIMTVSAYTAGIANSVPLMIVTAFGVAGLLWRFRDDIIEPGSRQRFSAMSNRVFTMPRHGHPPRWNDHPRVGFFATWKAMDRSDGRRPTRESRSLQKPSSASDQP